MQKFKSVEELINQLKPENQFIVLERNSILTAVINFSKKISWKYFICCKNKSSPRSN